MDEIFTKKFGAKRETKGEEKGESVIEKKMTILCSWSEWKNERETRMTEQRNLAY